jgi:hypothetical protein
LGRNRRTNASLTITTSGLPLPKIQVRHRVRLLQRVNPLEVLHDADDFNAGGPDGYHAANRPAVRPDAAGERFIHDGDARTVRHVMVVEFAALHDTDAQHLEVPRTDQDRAHLIRLRRIDRVAGSRTGVAGRAQPGNGGAVAGLAASTPGIASRRSMTSR